MLPGRPWFQKWALPYVGARRLEHLQYLVGDPLVRRFTGLARVPTARTVGNWLRRFTQETLRPLVQRNQDVVLDTVARLRVPRLTLDVDGRWTPVLLRVSCRRGCGGS